MRMNDRVSMAERYRYLDALDSVPSRDRLGGVRDASRRLYNRCFSVSSTAGSVHSDHRYCYDDDCRCPFADIHIGNDSWTHHDDHR